MFNVPVDSILWNVLYLVTGEASVLYNGGTYATGSTFRGVPGVTTFAYSGSGTQEVVEVTEFKGAAIEFAENAADEPVFTDQTAINGFTVEYALNDAEKIVNEVTQIEGFAIEFVDYPFYSFEITETRL